MITGYIIWTKFSRNSTTHPMLFSFIIKFDFVSRKNLRRWWKIINFVSFTFNDNLLTVSQSVTFFYFTAYFLRGFYVILTFEPRINEDNEWVNEFYQELVYEKVKSRWHLGPGYMMKLVVCLRFRLSPGLLSRHWWVTARKTSNASHIRCFLAINEEELRKIRFYLFIYKIFDENRI